MCFGRCLTLQCEKLDISRNLFAVNVETLGGKQLQKNSTNLLKDWGYRNLLFYFQRLVWEACREFLQVQIFWFGVLTNNAFVSETMRRGSFWTNAGRDGSGFWRQIQHEEITVGISVLVSVDTSNKKLIQMTLFDPKAKWNLELYSLWLGDA